MWLNSVYLLVFLKSERKLALHWTCMIYLSDPDAGLFFYQSVTWFHFHHFYLSSSFRFFVYLSIKKPPLPFPSWITNLFVNSLVPFAPWCTEPSETLKTVKQEPTCTWQVLLLVLALAMLVFISGEYREIVTPSEVSLQLVFVSGCQRCCCPCCWM